jgi:hypothetical protein
MPEVGEYAKYRFSDLPNDEQSATMRLASEGELELRCVERTEIDGVPHLWLEVELPHRVSPSESEVPSQWNLKVLVAADGLLSHDCEIVRGWTVLDREEAFPFSDGLASELAMSEEIPGVVGDLLRMTIIGVENEASIESTIEITIADEALTLTTAVGGSRSSQKISRGKERLREYHSTWWLDESRAFGVAAWEMTTTANDYRVGDTVPDRTWSATQRLELIEFGTGATSRWPDHN